MSKIYEALLRAEIERLQQQTPGEATPTAPTETDAPRATAMQEATAPPPVSLPIPENVLPVRRQAWRADEARLPALERRGAAVEQIRALRSKLNQLRLDMPLKTILISSGQAGEGKSFVAANLAVSLSSHRGANVLLIDGDMRRGTLHKLLGTPSGLGLTDYLAGVASLGDVLQQVDPQAVDAVKHKGLLSLSFISCGEDTESAADLSVNGRFQALLEQVRDSFDWIIVDSPPVNLVADGVNFAVSCDGVILVARAAMTRYEVAQHAQEELKSAKVLGVVLNAATNVAPIGGYYGYDR